MTRLFLLEDDEALAEALAWALEKNDFAVTRAATLAEARKLLAGGDFALLVLDVGLPDGSGFGLCRELRAAGSAVPILFLTAADEEVSIIRGLDAGGDDYLTKPFRLGELCSRIRALLRRSGRAAAAPGSLASGPVRIDLAASRVFLHGEPLEVTGMEYRLLCLFLQNAGLTLPRQRIMDVLWDGSGDFVDDNTLSVYIRRLREKIEPAPSRPVYLVTVRGFGYQWRRDAP